MTNVYFAFYLFLTKDKIGAFTFHYELNLWKKMILVFLFIAQIIVCANVFTYTLALD